MFFFAIAKNSNWEILTKNLVTFKGLDGVKLYFWGSLKNLIFLGEGEGYQYIGGLPKKRAWIVCRFNEGVGMKEWGSVFEK